MSSVRSYVSTSRALRCLQVLTLPADGLLRGQYCLTEIGHGLDAINMETTATLLESGEFDLHTPTEAAAK